MIKVTKDSLMKEAMALYKHAETTRWAIKTGNETYTKGQKIYLNCIACNAMLHRDQKSAKEARLGSSARWCPPCTEQFYKLWDRVSKLPDPKEFCKEFSDKTTPYDHWQHEPKSNL